MRPTLIILLVLACGLLLYRVYFYQSAQPTTLDPAEEAIESGEVPNAPEYELPPPPGQPPSEPAVIEISHEVRQRGAQHRLHIFLTETHGWWVDRIYVVFWYQEKDAATGELKKYQERYEFIPRAIDFGATLEHSFVIYETDFPAGKPKGTTENWGVRVDSWDAGRVRAPATPN